MKVGILGAGKIAAKMAETINGMTEAECYAIAARDMERAEEFARTWKVEKAYGSYEEMLSDSEVDLVYIALPHSHHKEWTIKALKAGRNVLCEKAFAVTEAEAKEMIETARAEKKLLAEAIWTRYMPSRKLISDCIGRGEIGEVVSVDSNLGYRIDHVERLMDPKLAGGCLLDLTVYCLNFSSMILGDGIKRFVASQIPTPTGVDGQNCVMAEYEGGQMATMFSTMFAQTDRKGLIAGRDGFIEVWNINNPERITVHKIREGKEEIYEIPVPEQITGYEYEVLACKRAIEAGKIECEDMPHSEILEIMRQMDTIRKKPEWMEYPC